MQAADEHYRESRSDYLAGLLPVALLPPSLLPYLGICGWRTVPEGPRIVPGSVRHVETSDDVSTSDYTTDSTESDTGEQSSSSSEDVISSGNTHPSIYLNEQ